MTTASGDEKPAFRIAYPASPHIVGVNWIELPVSDPARTALLYEQVGWHFRGKLKGRYVLGLAGLVVHLVQRDQPAAALVFELAVDQVDLKHRQLIELGQKPRPLRQLRRGDRAFTWRDPDGYTFRFVGPARRPDDKKVE